MKKKKTSIFDRSREKKSGFFFFLSVTPPVAWEHENERKREEV